MKKSIIILLSCLFLIIPNFEAVSKDFLDIGRITGEIFFGSISGMSLLVLTGELLGARYVAGAYAGHADYEGYGNEIGRPKILVGTLALSLGSSAGVYIAGTYQKEKAPFLEETKSFLATFGSSTLFLLVIGGRLFQGQSSMNWGGDGDPWNCCIVPISWFSSVIGAVIGFNATRGYIISDNPRIQPNEKTPLFRTNLIKGVF